MKFDEYLEKNEVECKTEPRDYNTFIYVNEDIPNIEDFVNQQEVQ